MSRKITESLVIISCAALMASALLFLTVFQSHSVKAQATTGEIPYGGQRVYTLTCDCSGNLLLYIYDYRTKSLLTLLYQYGASILYSYYNVYGTYLLGTYTSSGNTCQIYVGEGCVVISSQGQLGNRPGTGTSAQ